MFDLPASKAVRRSELDSPRSSRSSSPDASGSAAAAQAKLAAYFSNIYEEHSAADNDADANESISDPKATQDEAQADDIDGTVAFRLFSTSAVTATEPSRILIRSPTPENKEPGLIVTRNASYYLAKPWSKSHREAAASLIYTPERVATEAAKPWPGCILPWRVRTVRMSARQMKPLRKDNGISSVETVVAGEFVNGLGMVEGERKRCKPGKKKRMVIRGKQRAKVQAEEAEKEKKTRRNREKKVKKREREKAKKAAGKSAEGVNVEEADTEAKEVISS